MKSITDQIISRIKRRKPGWVFTPRDFLDVGSRVAVDQVLSRLVKQGMVRRLDRGIYDHPKQSTLLGTLSPNPDNIARAMAAGDDVFPSGAMAANLLGLSTQVPAKPSYLTNATTRTRRVAGQTIQSLLS
jgi:predicted transcriptional regulator of viral defense system